MYKPKFNHVLVEIDDKDSVWGKSGEASMGGEAYREGTLISVADAFFPFGDTNKINVEGMNDVVGIIKPMVGKTVMWNQGHEAGTVFEEGGKKYALIYWWDVIGVKE